MNTIIDTLKKKFATAIKEDVKIEITQSTSEKFGHYQCNSAMKLAKILDKNPREIATEIVNSIEKDGMISKLEIAGPGFINITLDSNFLSQSANEMLQDERLGIPLPESPKKIIVEFSSPNTAKELHVGHLRSTIIGDCIARLLEFLGHNVLRLNHIGNWGTPFGMLIAYMKEKVPNVLAGKETTDLPTLQKWYKRSKKKFDEEEEFKERSQKEVVRLQGGDKETLHAWEIICEISRHGYQEIYDLLDVKLNERGESFYNPMLAKTVKDLEKKGLIEISDGAKCIFLDGFKTREDKPLPLIVQKSDGGYNYATTDMAAMNHRANVENAERIIVITDAGQKLHFQMVHKASVLAKNIDPQKTEFNHITFGLVLGPDGKKFKTRSGDTERLIDLIYAAINKAKEIVAERFEKGVEESAQKIGIGAIKYADLSCSRTGDYTFSYERMLRFEGNTAAFIMYSYVRTAGIKRKVGIDIEKLKKDAKITIDHPSEIALAVHLLQFNEALNNIYRDLMPNRLTDYLYELANKFNAFFRDCRVIGSDEQSSRLLLCELTANVLNKGLNILGLQTVEKM